MSLPHAILGILHEQPMTGYDLKTQYFDQSIAHFWPADQAQIYRTLDKMAADGWVESQLEIQDNRPNRKVYSITDTGRAELRHWLTTSLPLVSYREPFLIQLFFMKLLSNEQILSMIEAQQQAHQARLAEYRKLPIPPLDDPSANREMILQRLTLELGLRVEQANLDWLLMAHDLVEQMGDQ
jgi:PadR family transcriptional regulator, regulatory protein AphA